MKKGRVAIGFLLAVVLLAGCSKAVIKSPEKLLSLSVAGLSGIDRYTFDGRIETSAFGKEPVTFRGKVENHDRMTLNSVSGGLNFESLPHPLQLLKQIQQTADKTMLLGEQSGNRTAVLQIDADSEQAARRWAELLRGDMRQLGSKVPALQSSGGATASAAQKTAFEREWREELKRSDSELERMLATLQVRSRYVLTIDRQKLLPLKLREQTELRYRLDGEPQTERRSAVLNFFTASS